MAVTKGQGSKGKDREDDDTDMLDPNPNPSIDAYDKIIRGVGNITTYVDEIPREFYEQLPYKGFNPTYVAHKCINTFGFVGSLQLANIASIRGTNTDKYPTMSVNCDGTDLKGSFTIRNLVDTNFITRYGVMRIGAERIRNNDAIPLSQIAAALPFATFTYVSRLQEQNQDVSRFEKNVVTSLPISLQYVTAGALPLGPKTRSAHIRFVAEFSKVIGSRFNAMIYDIQYDQSRVYTTMRDLVARLEEVEKDITLNENEQNATVEVCHREALNIMVQPLEERVRAYGANTGNIEHYTPKARV